MAIAVNEIGRVKRQRKSGKKSINSHLYFFFANSNNFSTKQENYKKSSLTKVIILKTNVRNNLNINHVKIY